MENANTIQNVPATPKNRRQPPSTRGSAFKATPVNKKVLNTSCGGIGIPKVVTKPVTKVRPFSFATDKRLALRKTSTSSSSADGTTNGKTAPVKNQAMQPFALRRQGSSQALLKIKPLKAVQVGIKRKSTGQESKSKRVCKTPLRSLNTNIMVNTNTQSK